MNTDQEYSGPPRVVDKRGQNHKPKLDTTPSPERELTQEQLDILTAQAMNDDSTMHDPQMDPVLTAFLVTVDHQGNVQATADIEQINTKLISRPASLADMYSAAAHIQKDINAQEQTAWLMRGMQQQAAQMREQLEAAKLQAQMAGATIGSMRR